MDYKYIEQLLERYWDCETSPEEEAILRTFFSQSDVPVHLLKYKSLFTYAKKEAEAKHLGEDFDNRVWEAIHTPVVKARPLTFASRFNGLYRAAAAVAIICLLGGIGNQIFQPDSTPSYTEQKLPGGQTQVATNAALSDKHVSMIDSTKSGKQAKSPNGIVTE